MKTRERSYRISDDAKRSTIFRCRGATWSEATQQGEMENALEMLLLKQAAKEENEKNAKEH